MNFTMEKQDNFEFKGFTPRLALKQKAKDIYTSVENRSPSESTKVASITKIKEGYQAQLKITSASCIFEITTKKKTCSVAMDQLYERFLSEILNWNKERNFDLHL